LSATIDAVDDDALRLIDLLTTASAVANYLGAGDVRADHLRAAYRLARGEATLEEIGRPQSPLVPRRGNGGATNGVRTFAQRWYALLGARPEGTLGASDLPAFTAELNALTDD
jgi:hypothetical protein